jgi:hypothetical protein
VTVQAGWRSIPERDVVGRATLSWDINWPRMTAYIKLKPRLRMHGAITPLPVNYVFIVLCLIKSAVTIHLVLLHWLDLGGHARGEHGPSLGFSQPLKHILQVKQVLWNVRPITITSSKYTRHETYVRPRRTVPINLSNVTGALQRPKGMTVNRHNPSPVENAARTT